MTTAVYDMMFFPQSNGTNVSSAGKTIFEMLCTTDAYPSCQMVTCRSNDTGISTKRIELNCSDVETIIIVLVFALLAVSIVLGNLLIIYATVTSKRQRKAHDCIKFSLAMADLLQGALAVPASAYTYTHFYFKPGPYTGSSIMQAWHDFLKIYRVSIFCFILSNTLSLFSLVTLSVDRFLAIRYPFRYHAGELMTRGRVYSCVAITWFISIGLSAFFEESLAREFLGEKRQRYVDDIIRGASVVFALCYVTIIGLLAFTVHHSISAIRKIQKLSATTSATNNRPEPSVERRFAATVAVMTAAFSVSVAPYVILMLSGVETDWWLELIFECLLYTNSLWNVIIYSARCDSFQEAARRLPGTRTLLQCCIRSRKNKDMDDTTFNMTTTGVAAAETVAIARPHIWRSRSSKKIRCASSKIVSSPYLKRTIIDAKQEERNFRILGDGNLTN